MRFSTDVRVGTVGVLLGVASFFAGRATAPAAALPAAAAAPAPSPRARVPEAAPASPAPGGEEDCGALRPSLDAERERTRGLELELFGTANPWPDAAAQQRAEAEYRAVLDEVLAECLDGWTLRKIACDEDPCIGVLWPPKMGMGSLDLSGCPPWVERYTEVTQDRMGIVLCPEFPGMTYALAPAPPWQQAAQRGEEASYDGTVVLDVEQRVEYRLQELIDEEEPERCSEP